jgi:hypothetical protein
MRGANSFAYERMDIWVLKVSIAVPLVCLVGLILWHLTGQITGKWIKTRRRPKLSPEPPPSIPSSTRLPSESSDTRVARRDPPDSVIPSVFSTRVEIPQDERARRARELLALSQDDFRNHRNASCLNHCQTLAATYPDLPEATEAGQLAAQIKNDPDRLQQACAGLAESLAVLYLELAECQARAGESEQAAASYQKIIRCCPESRQAQVAQDRLRQTGIHEARTN